MGDRPVSLAEALSRWTIERSTDPAFTFLERGETECEVLTFQELHRQALAVRTELLARALKGKPVLLVYAPGLAFIAAFCGCLLAGVIAVPAPYLVPRRSRE